MAVQLNIKNNRAILNFSDNCDDVPSDENCIIDILSEKNIKTVYAEISDKSVSPLIAAEIYAWCKKLESLHIAFNFSRLPQNEQDLLALSLKSVNIPPTFTTDVKPCIVKIGEFGYGIYKNFNSAIKFINEAFVSVLRFITGKAVFRKKDFWFIFEDCSYKAIGITALVSFLVGLILAFVGAMQLRTFGAGIYVASMVALGMTRIMAAIMVGVIMAGRTGSSYAATIGTMQVNEEIDALKTLGIQVSDYLVAPRLVSLVVTIPFLTLLADALGIIGGTVVGIGFLGISPVTYFEYSVKALDSTNILVGLLHSLVYGFIIAVSGCYKGLNAGRDADAVGKATTSAVVTALVWMIVATGILTVILEVIGI